MKKLTTILMIISVIMTIFGTQKYISALNLGEMVEITGNTLLPNLFYEHNLFNHRTVYGDIIYCLDPDKVGTENSSYQGYVIDKIDQYNDSEVSILKSVIINGYPNKYSSNIEYHSITSMAIRALCMEFKGLTKGRTAENYISIQHGESYAKQECIDLIKYAKKNPYLEEYNDISVKYLSDIKIVTDNGTMVGKEYIIDGSNISGPITIKTNNNNESDIILPENIVLGQPFKILVPLENTYNQINENLEITYKTKTGLVCIKTGLLNRQNYIGILNVDQEIKTSLNFSLESKVAKLKIFKKDIDSQEILTGAKFRIWSSKPNEINDTENLIGTFVTDEFGYIEVNNIDKLGTYFIKEICYPVGYEVDKENKFDSVVIDKFGVSYNKIIYNRKKQILGSFIKIKGYKEVASKQPVEYKILNATNASNVPLENFTISIPIPSDYYDLKSMIIGDFIENQSYLMYLIDSDNKQREIKKILEDKEGEINKDVEGTFNCNEIETISVSAKGIKELTISLSKESKGINFKTPIFGKGEYSIYIKNANKEYLLGDNYDGKKEYNFECKDLVSYRIVFKTPIFINEFKTGTFIADNKSNETYSVLIDTNKRKNFLIEENLYANKKNLLKFNENEKIFNISILFKDPVKPGFSQASPIVLTGVSNNLRAIVNVNQYFINRAEIKGEYMGNEVKNWDEWNTITYSKELKLKKGTLPRTGFYIFLLMGSLIVIIGLFTLIIWRFSNE